MWIRGGGLDCEVSDATLDRITSLVTLLSIHRVFLRMQILLYTRSGIVHVLHGKLVTGIGFVKRCLKK